MNLFRKYKVLQTSAFMAFYGRFSGKKGRYRGPAVGFCNVLVGRVRGGTAIVNCHRFYMAGGISKFLLLQTLPMWYSAIQ